jgi:outer membrane cobalamin receptor
LRRKREQASATEENESGDCPVHRRIASCVCTDSRQYRQRCKKDAPQRVVVTGSNIKRIDVETAAPLQVISRKEIQQSGAITAKDILELTTSNDRSALSDLGGSNSWASGSSGASLRNLGVNSTLVLINGRRLPNYGFADGTKDTFVNIDSIPVLLLIASKSCVTAHRQFTVLQRLVGSSTSSHAKM